MNSFTGAILKISIVLLFVVLFPMGTEKRNNYAFTAEPNAPPVAEGDNIEKKPSSQDIRIWKENGKIKASNTAFPEKSTTIEAVEKNPAPPPSRDAQEAMRKARETEERNRQIRELKSIIKRQRDNNQALTRQRQVQRRAETPFYDMMGHAVIPVVFGYEDREITAYMMLDTGATGTSIHSIVLEPLGLTDFYPSLAQLADGRRIKVLKARVDYVQVGPFIKKNFLISTFPYKKKKKRVAQEGEIIGLLGMNFLQDHPFTLDHSRRVIIWW